MILKHPDLSLDNSNYDIKNNTRILFPAINGLVTFQGL